MANQVRRRTSVTATSIAEEAIPHLPLFGKAAKAKLVGKVPDACKTIAEVDPETFLFLPRSGARDVATIEILRSPEAADPQGRVQSYQAIAKRQRRKFRDIDPDELRLFNPDQVNEFDAVVGEAEQLLEDDPEDSPGDRP